jgi:hypothetical protein
VDTAAETSEETTPRRGPAWRTGDLPWFVLVAGFLVLVVVTLGLASAGGWGGVAGMAVLLAAAVVLLGLWCDPLS